MPIYISMAVGNGKMLCLCSRHAADAGRKGNLISCNFSGNNNPFLLGENQPSVFSINQRPESTGGKKQLPGGIQHTVITGKEHMHRFTRPGFKEDPFVIFRHTVDQYLLACKHPQKTPVQRLVPPGAELLGVVNRGFLHQGKETGRP